MHALKIAWLPRVRSKSFFKLATFCLPFLGNVRINLLKKQQLATFILDRWLQIFLILKNFFTTEAAPFYTLTWEDIYWGLLLRSHVKSCGVMNITSEAYNIQGNMTIPGQGLFPLCLETASRSFPPPQDNYSLPNSLWGCIMPVHCTMNCKGKFWPRVA